MAVLLWVVLLSAGVSLSQAQESFSKLPDIYKKGVELALREIDGHHLFFRSIHQAETEEGYIYHNFYLKATKYKNNQPPVDCVICYKTSAGIIHSNPKPYLNCVQQELLSKVFPLHQNEEYEGFIT